MLNIIHLQHHLLRGPEQEYFNSRAFGGIHLRAFDALSYQSSVVTKKLDYRQEYAPKYFYNRGTAPFDGMTVGDQWFNDETGVLYHAIKDDQTPWCKWVDLSGKDIFAYSTTEVTSGSYNALSTDHYIGVSYDGPATVILPFPVINGSEYIVKDESGRAGDPGRSITIQGSSGKMIDNQSSAVINIDNGALQMIYREGWRIV